MAFPKGKAEKRKRVLSSKTLRFVFSLRKAGLVKLGLGGFQMQILQATLGELDIVFESDWSLKMQQDQKRTSD